MSVFPASKVCFISWNARVSAVVRMFKMAFLVATFCIATDSSRAADDAKAKQEVEAKVLTPAKEEVQFFEQHIRPVLIERCYECHSVEKGKSKGGLVLDSRDGWMKGGDNGTAIVPGDPEKSLLVKAIRYTDPDLQMPPKEVNRLSEKQIAHFVDWIKMGAPDPRVPNQTNEFAAKFSDRSKFWSFQPISRPSVPEVKHAEWARNEIDRFVLAKLQEKGLTPAPEADKRTLARRVYFDLIGLPPTPEQVDTFIKDESPNAYEKMIDSLLASKQYGERWGRHWLDVARYADSGGYETDIYFRNAWRYRDYVVKSFNDDKPYNIFVQEQVAGDELWPDDLGLEGSYQLPEQKKRNMEARIGTGFYTLGTQIHESNMDAGKIRYETLTDWVDTTGAAFMGLTIGCARCHDHKFDPFTQQDYFSMQAIFAGSREVEVPLITGMGIADFKQSYPRVIAVVEARKALKLFEEKNKGKQLTDEQKKERQRLLENIANQLLAVPEGTAHDGPYDGIFEIPTATVLGPERKELIPVTKVLNRGELTRAREEVNPALPRYIKEITSWDLPLPQRFGGRKELALWLTDSEHPLTSRVMINRLWHWHFGRGIVATPNDFGSLGEKPTHPELLDWLARRFSEQGWSIKKMHKLIMLSSTYRMDSRFDHDENKKIDPANSYLWRMNRRRLEAEALWDSVHSVAGNLNLKMGGTPIMPPLDKDEMAPGNWIVPADEAEHRRRGLYILVRRNFKFPMFDVFDSPINAVSAGARDTTTVAPQALYFLNNRTMFKQAAVFAGRLIASANKPGSWNQPDFGAGQPGWEGPSGRPHAGWAKRVENGHALKNFDVPAGTVVTHGPSSVLLRIPEGAKPGTATINGGLWNIRRYGRAGEWKLWHNDEILVAKGSIDDSSGSSKSPLDLGQGTDTAERLKNIPFKGGDTFRLEILEDDFVGVNLKIVAGETYDLAGQFSPLANPTKDGWQYSQGLAAGGGPVGSAVQIEQAQVEGNELASAVVKAWRLALQRNPTPEEKSESLELIEQLAREATPIPNPPESLKQLPPEQGVALTKFCLALFNLNEFTYID